MQHSTTALYRPCIVSERAGFFVIQPTTNCDDMLVVHAVMSDDRKKTNFQLQTSQRFTCLHVV